MNITPSTDLICLSHLRWNFVFQRPNHLMSRFARERRVFFIEEAVEDERVRLESVEVSPNLWVCTPHVTPNLFREASESLVRYLVAQLITTREISRPILWFYTPMALPIAAGIGSSLVVYDCMDELSCFHGAPPELSARERQLFARADMVFTGGRSLYEAKCGQHSCVYLFPSSVDIDHFVKARRKAQDPPDQAAIGHKRVGFFGVIDERIDIALLSSLAQARPDVQIIMIGPVVKIPESSLPRFANIHYLGQKQYDELPAYISGWDAAIMPFALNEATRYISPTKTLEYLAAGLPIVSTAVRDVVIPYGESGLVTIADENGFPSAIDRALATDMGRHMKLVDRVLDNTSWDRTWCEMSERMLGPSKRETHLAMQHEVDVSCSTI